MGKRAKGRVYRNISGTKTGKIHTGRMREREEARRGGEWRGGGRGGERGIGKSSSKAARRRGDKINYFVKQQAVLC